MKKGSIYTYHPDHLGCSSWITDHLGEAVQHLQYLPFGERYVGLVNPDINLLPCCFGVNLFQDETRVAIFLYICSRKIKQN